MASSSYPSIFKTKSKTKALGIEYNDRRIGEEFKRQNRIDEQKAQIEREIADARRSLRVLEAEPRTSSRSQRENLDQEIRRVKSKINRLKARMAALDTDLANSDEEAKKHWGQLEEIILGKPRKPTK